MDNLGCLSILILMIELCVYLSYYKDIIFSIEISCFYLGIFYNQQDYPNIRAWGEVLFGISLAFIVITLMHNFKSAFYIKYTEETISPVLAKDSSLNQTLKYYDKKINKEEALRKQMMMFEDI
mmetsp:Transcript_28968/g.33069  ORF Transcript_28968/g.33069 Transcript_28968/m.33069 type:complete len:123 (+) Transcript_28968:822-1190(+)